MRYVFTIVFMVQGRARSIRVEDATNLRPGWNGNNLDFYAPAAAAAWEAIKALPCVTSMVSPKPATGSD